MIFSILTFFVTFIKIDISCNEFCQSLFVTPAIAPYKHLTEKKSAETEQNEVAVENQAPVVRHPFKPADVSDLGVIKFPVPEFLKKTQEAQIKYYITIYNSFFDGMPRHQVKINSLRGNGYFLMVRLI